VKYKPITRGYVHRRGDDEVKVVANEVWQAMTDIIANGQEHADERANRFMFIDGQCEATCPLPASA
jgi:hypothetical protein